MKTKYLFFSLFLIFFVLSFLTFPILMNIQTNHLQPLPNYPIATEHEEKKIALKIEDITSFYQALYFKKIYTINGWRHHL